MKKYTYKVKYYNDFKGKYEDFELTTQSLMMNIVAEQAEKKMEELSGSAGQVIEKIEMIMGNAHSL